MTRPMKPWDYIAERLENKGVPEWALRRFGVSELDRASMKAGERMTDRVIEDVSIAIGSYPKRLKAIDNKYQEYRSKALLSGETKLGGEE